MNRTFALALSWVVALLVGTLIAQAQEARRIGEALPVTSRWEVSLDGQVGLPSGDIKVGENKGGHKSPGTPLRLNDDLGIDVSEALEATVAYHIAPRDAIRGLFKNYFLDGSATVNRPVAYNGPTYGPGRLHSNFDFYRLGLAYERRLMDAGAKFNLTGTLGLSYVPLDARIQNNTEAFSRQELPVPIAGLRVEGPLGRRWGLQAFVEGGGLPRVDSGRQEGGTIFLEQHHVDAGLGIAFALTSLWEVHAGYRFTYFFQHEQSHEDNNLFQLIDHGFQLGLKFRF